MSLALAGLVGVGGAPLPMPSCPVRNGMTKSTAVAFCSWCAGRTPPAVSFTPQTVALRWTKSRGSHSPGIRSRVCSEAPGSRCWPNRAPASVAPPIVVTIGNTKPSVSDAPSITADCAITLEAMAQSAVIDGASLTGFGFVFPIVARNWWGDAGGSVGRAGDGTLTPSERNRQRIPGG